MSKARQTQHFARSAKKRGGEKIKALFFSPRLAHKAPVMQAWSTLIKAKLL